MCLERNNFIRTNKSDILASLMKPVILIIIASHVSCERQHLDEGMLKPVPAKCEGTTEMLGITRIRCHPVDILMIRRLTAITDKCRRMRVTCTSSSSSRKQFLPTKYLYRNCCVFPPFFTREVAKECGGAMELLFNDVKHNVTGYRRRAYDCDHWMCVLDRYGLLARYGDLDDEKYYAHLDLWVRLNPMFGDAMLEAKVFCKESVRPYLPLKPCEFYHLHGCIRNYLNVECPVLIPTKECEEKRDFFKECKQYYHKK